MSEDLFEQVKAVSYNAGGDETAQFAIVLADKGATKLDLLWVDSTGGWNQAADVPRREPADYGDEGGGDTWHVR